MNEALADAVRAIKDAPTLEAALECLASVEAIPYDRLVFVVFEDERRRMSVRWQRENGVSLVIPFADRTVRVADGAPAGWVRDHETTLREADTAQSPFRHHPVRDSGRRSLILAPIGHPPRALIGLTTWEPDRYSDDDAVLVGRLANALAMHLPTDHRVFD